MWSFSWVLWINILALYCYASPKPNLPAGYSVTATTDASGSVHEEIGVLTTISGSVSFVPKWNAVTTLNETLPIVTATNKDGRVVVGVGNWTSIPESIGSQTLEVIRTIAQTGVNAVTSSTISASITSSSSLIAPITNSSTIHKTIITSSSQSNLTPSSSQQNRGALNGTRSPDSSLTPGASTSTAKSTGSKSSTQTKISSVSLISSISRQLSTSSNGTGVVIIGSSSSSSASSKPHSSTGSSKTQSSTGSSDIDTSSSTGANTGSTSSNGPNAASLTSPTSTWTTTPSGFSVQSVSNTVWVGNLILTTTANGQETAVPVLRDCGNKCDSNNDHHGFIILWGIPVLPKISFNIPSLGFSFSMPCLIFCGGGGGGGGGGGAVGSPEIEDPENQSQPTQKTQSTEGPSKTSATKTSSTSSPSSSSCTISKTASDCVVACTAQSSCSTTCGKTTTGCDVTGTTSTTSSVVCSFTDSTHRCESTTASTGASGIFETAIYTSVNFDSARAASVAKEQLTQPTRFPAAWAKSLAATGTGPPVSGNSSGTITSSSSRQSSQSQKSSSQKSSNQNPTSQTSSPVQSLRNSILSSNSLTTANSTTSSNPTTASSRNVSSITSAPPIPITSCTLTSISAFSSAYTYYTIDYPATIGCACNNGWQAGVGTTVGHDSSITYTCEVGTTTRIDVSTAPLPSTSTTEAPKSTTPPPYQTGTCDLHIFEASLSYTDPLYAQLNITDGGNNLLTSQDYKDKWGDSSVVTLSDSKLPYDVNVTFTRSIKAPSRMLKKRIGAPIQEVNWEAWVVTLVAGDTQWNDKDDTDSTKLPYCSVGDWDNGNFWDWLNAVTSLGADEKSANRQMDCHWAC